MCMGSCAWLETGLITIWFPNQISSRWHKRTREALPEVLYGKRALYNTECS